MFVGARFGFAGIEAKRHRQILHKIIYATSRKLSDPIGVVNKAKISLEKTMENDKEACGLVGLRSIPGGIQR